MVIVSLRLVLGPSDVARITVRPALGPFAETLLAYSSLSEWHGPRTPPRLRRPGRDVRSSASARDRILASFLWLGPTVALDLFTLVGRSAQFGSSQDALLDAPRQQVAVEGEYWAGLLQHAQEIGIAERPAATAASLLAGLRDGTSTSRSALVEEMREFHARVIGDRWPLIRNQLAAEQGRLEQRLVANGVEGLLGALGDLVRFTGSAIDLPYAGVVSTCHSERALSGRGLTVIPSYFALEPQTYWPEDPAAPVMLIAPIQHLDERPTTRADVPKATGKLLGDTRAAALKAISRHTCTTSQLAATLGISVSGASQHASTLRKGCPTTASGPR